MVGGRGLKVPSRAVPMLSTCKSLILGGNGGVVDSKDGWTDISYVYGNCTVTFSYVTVIICTVANAYRGLVSVPSTRVHF